MHVSHGKSFEMRLKILSKESKSVPDGYGKELNPPQEPLQKGSRQTTSAIITLFPVLILLLISFVVYFNALHGDFVYDDKFQIVNNPWIRSVENMPVIFSKSVSSFQPGDIVSNYYRPLMHVVYMLNYHLFGLKPWGFHLVNILFHCGASILVFLVIRMLLTGYGNSAYSGHLSPPLIAAALFATHPIHTEAVTWIAGLPDVAFTFFYLFSFYLYARSRAILSANYLFSVLCFAIAALFKEPALTLPLLLFAYDYMFRERKKVPLTDDVKKYVPYLIIGAGYVALRIQALGGFAPKNRRVVLSAYQDVINIFPLFARYLEKLLLPVNLNAFYVFHPIASLFELRGVLSLAVTVVFVVLLPVVFRKNRTALMAFLFVIVPLLPVLYIPALGENAFTDRYLYLPSVGYMLLLAIFLSWVREKMPRAVSSITIVFIVIGGLYSIGTIARNNVWKDSFSLWTDTVKKSPDSEIAHNYLGIVYRSQGKLDKAIAEYQTALQLNPTYAEPHYNLGNAYLSKGQPDRAIAKYQTALRLKPGFANAYLNLGNAYEELGLLGKAIAEYQTALQLNPDDAGSHYNLGNAYKSQGKLDRAITEYRTALRLNPSYAEAYYNLGNTYLSQGQLDKANAEYRAALRLRPDYVEVYTGLGVVYGAQGQFDKAISEFQIALRLKPGYAVAHYNLGNAYESQGRIDMAITEFQTALRLNPDYFKARQRLNNLVSRRH